MRQNHRYVYTFIVIIIKHTYLGQSSRLTCCQLRAYVTNYVLCKDKILQILLWINVL